MNPVEQVGVRLLPYTALEMMTLFTVVVAWPIHLLGSCKLPVYAETQTRFCVNMSQQSIL